jgi:hypothetical protein
MNILNLQIILCFEKHIAMAGLAGTDSFWKENEDGSEWCETVRLRGFAMGSAHARVLTFPLLLL